MPAPDAADGRLLAVHCGEPRPIAWRGETIETAIFKSPVHGPVAVETLGLAGDRQADLSVHGGVDKAVYAYDESGMEHWRRSLERPELAAGAFGENLTLRGFPEEQVRIGDRFRIGSALFEVSQPRQPCMKLGVRFDDPGFPKRFFASGRVGFYLRVLESGTIAAGDPVVRMRQASDAIDVRQLVAIWRDRNASAQQLARATASEALASAWREPLRARLERGPTMPPS